MAFYMVNTKQIASTVAITALFAAVATVFVNTLISYFEMPEVYVSATDGSCVKVVNFKNGDAYTCTDKDIILRKYHVKPM